MKIALLQMDIAFGDVLANRHKVMAMMEEGLRQNAKLFVLPELWTTGYVLNQLLQLGETEQGPTIQMLRKAAHENGVEIITGSIAEIRNKQVYNTAYAIDANGMIVGKYRKIHLVPMMNEEKYLTPGDKKGIFELSFGKSGIIICYDLRFTELSRSLALNDCRTMFVAAQWPAIRGKHWLTLNLARAIENQMFVIAVNRVGQDANNRFFGHSLVIDPWGEIIAEGSETDEQVIVVDVDFSIVDVVRKQIPIFADRRPQYY